MDIKLNAVKEIELLKWLCNLINLYVGDEQVGLLGVQYKKLARKYTGNLGPQDNANIISV